MQTKHATFLYVGYITKLFKLIMTIYLKAHSKLVPSINSADTYLVRYASHISPLDLWNILCGADVLYTYYLLIDVTTLLDWFRDIMMLNGNIYFYRSLSRSKSRSRSHSFSPPPPGENGKPAEEEKPIEDEEKTKLKEEAINALPPYYPALQVNKLFIFIFYKYVY